jgi:uncharacterized protein (DUF1499 family)
MYDEPRTSGTARLAVVLGVLSLLLLISAGPLHHAGLVGLAGAFTVLKWAIYGAAATLVLAVAGLIIAARRWGSKTTALVALVLALVSLGSVGVLAAKASRLPAIHDVTTDLMQPPPFLAVIPLRAGAQNPVEYGGPAIAEKQRTAYADLQPLILTVPPPRAFERALAAARAMGWAIVASDPAGGRIEATDTTFWFGFKDDVVVRVVSQPSGSRIDVRSVSRVGIGDLGANAARIRSYLAAVKATS